MLPSSLLGGISFNADVCDLCPERRSEMSKKVTGFYRESSIVGNSCITYQCWWFQGWMLKIGISGYTLVPREPRSRVHPPVWMLSDCASAHPDSAPWRTALVAMTATSGWTARMASTVAVSSCVCSRWRPSRTTPLCTTSSCSAGELSCPWGQPAYWDAGLSGK